MFYKVLYNVLCYAYGKARSTIKAKIDDPDSDWDEMALKVLDALFDYKE